MVQERVEGGAVVTPAFGGGPDGGTPLGTIPGGPLDGPPGGQAHHVLSSIHPQSQNKTKQETYSKIL